MRGRGPDIFDCSRLVFAAALILVGAAAASAQAPPPPAPEPATSTLTVFVRGVPIGTEQVSLARTADGWTIGSTGRLGAPLDVLTRRLQVRYTPDWKPVELTLDTTVRGQAQTLHTTVDGTTATTRASLGGDSTTKTDTISADALLLPNPLFGPFEALAVRLRTAAQGSTIAAYQPPTVAFAIAVGDSSTEDIQTASALVHARRTHVTFEPPGLPPVEADVFADESTGRLLRVSIPAQGLEVVREDVASVTARRVTVSRPNDEAVRIPANGFVLAGTVSRPPEPSTKPLPGVVLVGGSGPADRDELVFGIPILGQLSTALADAGFVVLRYDKRGVGQSGGRGESATLADYADDLRAAVRFMDDRKDVDPKRLAVVGHSEGGSVAMIAAAADKRITALVLVAAMGVTGAELNMEQVKHQLDKSGKSDADKQATIELQGKIQQAVLTGKGWEGIPAPLRAQADTAWFQSLLAFDPSKVMPGIKQPILIVQGTLDVQVPPSNADRLVELARARKNSPPVDEVKIPGVNHLLAAATTGEVAEYASLKDKRISPEVTGAIVSWLQKTWSAPAK
jgi:pimeloyl-ACP methyl ester carboxylesterase